MELEINDYLIEVVIQHLKELEKVYQLNQALFLTEDDIKCHLFRILDDLFSKYSPTINPGVTGSALHSEVKFYDENEHLTLVPDITIINPSNLSIYHSVEFRITNRGAKYGPLPSKSFESGGEAFVIELKFCRERVGITRANIQSYQSDFDKLKRLREIMNTRSQGQNKLFGVVAVFNKTDNGRILFEEFESNNQNQHIRIFYGTGNVDFSIVDRYYDPYPTRINSSQ